MTQPWIGVGEWDWTKSGGSGAFGMGKNAMTWSDIMDAKAGGATPYQQHQLFDRAIKEGIHIGKGVAPNLQAGTHGSAGPRPTGEPIRFGDYGGWNMGYQDLLHLVGGAGNIHRTDSYQKVKDAANWASQHGVKVGGGIHDWLTSTADKIANLNKPDPNDQIIRELQDTNANLLAMAQEVAKPQEPPKPRYPGSGGHFVPGTTRFQSRQQATVRKASKSGSLKGRFGRRGAGFQSALAIGGGGGSGSRSVLNTAA